jgi:hypothetical protein
MSIVKPATFDISKLSISVAKKLDNGSNQAYINYDGKKLRIQAPRMPIPMDASDYQGNEKFKVQLSFRDKDSNPAVAAYYNSIQAIDNFLISHAEKNSGPWWKKPGMSHESVVDRFTPSIKVAKDKEGNPKPYPPTHAVALKKRNGAFDTELYDREKRLIEGLTPTDVLRRGSECTAILECTGIWITDKGFGATWKMFQARVDQMAEGMESGCAIDDDDETSPPVVTRKTISKPAAPTASNVVDSDEEADLIAAVKPAAKAAPAEEEEADDDEVVAAPAVPAAKPTVKKVVKKVVAKA